MKDFTTPANISPIIDEIKNKYLIKTDETTRHYFNCVLALYNPVNREIIPVIPEKVLYIPHLKNYIDLCGKINDYTQAAETYAGELDAWNTHEKSRVFNAIRDNLINQEATQ